MPTGLSFIVVRHCRMGIYLDAFNHKEVTMDDEKSLSGLLTEDRQ